LWLLQQLLLPSVGPKF